MKQEHKYAHVLRWLADGEKIQVNVNGWTTLSPEGVLRHILTETHNEFRIAPRTITIAGREIESPVDVEYAKKRLLNHEACYVMTADGAVRHSSSYSFEYVLACAEAGFVFANEDAALRALEAVKAALKGGSNA